MKWVTRERPKIDRIACPWLIARVIDQEPEFLYVPAGDVLATAQRSGAVPYDILGVEMSHVGALCSFDAFLGKHGLADPALQQHLPVESVHVGTLEAHTLERADGSREPVDRLTSRGRLLHHGARLSHLLDRGRCDLDACVVARHADNVVEGEASPIESDRHVADSAPAAGYTRPRFTTALTALRPIR